MKRVGLHSLKESDLSFMVTCATTSQCPLRLGASSVVRISPLVALGPGQTNPTFHRAAYNFARLCSALLGAALLRVVALPCSVLLCLGLSNEYNIPSNIPRVS